MSFYDDSTGYQDDSLFICDYCNNELTTDIEMETGVCDDCEAQCFDDDCEDYFEDEYYEDGD